MISLYETGINGILADEMGLGKTVQAIALAASFAVFYLLLVTLARTGLYCAYASPIVCDVVASPVDVPPKVMRHFAKLQVDEEPAIRTNTTICLGKIAQHIDASTRQNVLIAAFARSLKDPTPPHPTRLLATTHHG